MTKKKATKKTGYKRATFTFMAPEAQRVQLAGDFNSWDTNTHPLKKHLMAYGKEQLISHPEGTNIGF